MKNKFLNAVRDHFRSYSLSGKQMDRLREINAAVQVSSSKKRKISNGSWALTGLALVLGIAVYFYNADSKNSYSDLAREIAYHHNKKMDLEFEGESLSEIKNKFAKLDFPLVHSRQVSGPEWTLLGGRYCTLRGKMGVELKVLNKNTGETHTFYQILKPDGFPELTEPFVKFEQGVKVRIWKEKGIILAITQF